MRLPARRLAPPFLLLLLGLACAAGPAAAHMSGVSQVRMTVDGPLLAGEWEIHLHDARLAIGLDPSVGGDSGWVELRAHEAELRRLLASRLELEADGRPLRFAFTAAPMVWKRATGTVQLALTGRAAAPFAKLRIAYLLLFDVDAGHRGFFAVTDGRATHLGTFKKGGERWIELDIRQFHLGKLVGDFLGEGVRHIVSGLDHVLFLVALLLPAPLLRRDRAWTARAGFWPTGREVLKVVTAFTVAHSITLGLSFFGIVHLPVKWVESAIALSVFAAAWNNLHPFLPGRAWILAFGFGLVHGFGFASALGGLAAPLRARGLALGAFNVGVEVGQLAMVAIALPLLWVASRQRLYPKAVLGVGSFAIAWMAVLWFAERAFNLSLMGGP